MECLIHSEKELRYFLSPSQVISKETFQKNNGLLRGQRSTYEETEGREKNKSFDFSFLTQEFVVTVKKP